MKKKCMDTASNIRFNTCFESGLTGGIQTWLLIIASAFVFSNGGSLGYWFALYNHEIYKKYLQISYFIILVEK